MSRHENDDISSLDIPENKKIEMNLEIDGIICAKTIYFKHTDREQLFVLCNGAQLFNPLKRYDLRYTKKTWKMRRVNKTIFDYYYQFLNTKRETFLRYAEREL